MFQDQPGSSKCTDCVKGQYQRYERNTTCNECPLGYGNIDDRSSTCNQVPAGSFLLENGEIKTCDIGFFCTGTDKPKQKCIVGMYAPNDGLIKCLGCTPGQYQDQLGQSECKNCPVGQSRGEDIQDRSKCIICKLGYTSKSNGSTVCDTCSVGRIGSYYAG